MGTRLRGSFVRAMNTKIRGSVSGFAGIFHLILRAFAYLRDNNFNLEERRRKVNQSRGARLKLTRSQKHKNNCRLTEQ